MWRSSMSHLVDNIARNGDLLKTHTKDGGPEGVLFSNMMTPAIVKLTIHDKRRQVIAPVRPLAGLKLISESLLVKG